MYGSMKNAVNEGIMRFFIFFKINKKMKWGKFDFYFLRCGN